LIRAVVERTAVFTTGVPIDVIAVDIAVLFVIFTWEEEEEEEEVDEVSVSVELDSRGGS
jgi:hypothetical protein